MPALVRALKSVDLPTFGSPTIPQRRLIARGGAGAAHACSFRFLRVQQRHRALVVAVREGGPHRQPALDRLAYRAPLLRERRPEHVVDDGLLRNGRIARMADAEPQPPKVGRAELGSQVAEAIVPGHAAAELELHLAGREV